MSRLDAPCYCLVTGMNEKRETGGKELREGEIGQLQQTDPNRFSPVQLRHSLIRVTQSVNQSV